jgi:hypothetical protein
MMPMIATTIRSSTSVKPLLRDLIGHHPARPQASGAQS